MNSSKKDALYGLIDSMAYRGSIAALSLLLAAVASFETLGFYATITLVLGLYQAIFEGLIRQVSGRFFISDVSANEIKRIALAGSLLFSLILPVVIIGYGIRHSISLELVLSAIPLTLAPIALALSTFEQRVAQTQQRWKLLATARLRTLTPVFLICAAGTFFTGDLLFPSLLLPISETLLFLILRAKRVSFSLTDELNFERPRDNREIGGMLFFQLTSWINTQADRVVLALLASSRTLGIYTLASSIAKVPTEMVTFGLLSRQRALLANNSSAVERNAITSRRVILHVMATFAMYLVTICISLLLILFWPKFEEVARIIPLLATPTFISSTAAVVWVSSINDIGAKGKTKIQVVNTVLAGLGAGVAAFDLVLGCSLIALREMMSGSWILYRWKDLYDTRKLFWVYLSTLIAILVAFFVVTIV